MHTQRWIDAAVGQIQPDTAADVALKGAVELTRSPDGILQCKHGDAILGDVSAEGCSAVLAFLGDSASVALTWPLSATIRSIKRETGSKAITEVKVSELHP